MCQSLVLLFSKCYHSQTDLGFPPRFGPRFHALGHIHRREEAQRSGVRCAAVGRRVRI